MAVRPEPLTGSATLRTGVAWGARGLLVLLYGATALIGAATLPVATLLVAAPLVGLVTAVATGVVRIRRRGPSGPPKIVLPWVVGTALIPFGAGAFSLGSPVAGVVVLACMMCAAVWQLATDAPVGGRSGWSRGSDGSGGSRDHDRRDGHDDAWREEDDAALRAALRGASLETLFSQWQVSESELARAGRPYRGAVLLRELLLEEMYRRDPDGVERWLVDGDSRNPQFFVSADPRRGA